MATCAQFEPVAWWWTRNRIGQDLRKLYEVPKEPPPKLLASAFVRYNNTFSDGVGSFR